MLPINFLLTQQLTWSSTTFRPSEFKNPKSKSPIHDKSSGPSLMLLWVQLDNVSYSVLLTVHCLCT